MNKAHYTVLGAGGFIGSQLAKRIQQSGFTCYAPVRGDDQIFKKDLGHVFYCIGLTADYRDRPFDTIEAHVSYLSRIMKDAKFERLVYLSSTRLYDGLTGDICREADDLKLNPANPRHLYDLSKALGENLCLTFSEGRASVARLAAVYDTCPEATGFLPGIFRQMSTERNFTMDSSSGVSRDYVSLEDVVKSLMKIVHTSSSEIFNVASGQNISNQDIADALNVAGYNVKIARRSEREIRPLCDISKIRKLGIDPIPVQTYLQNLIKSGNFHGAR